MSDSVRPYGLQHARLLRPWVLRVRILEWVAMPSSRGSFRPQGSNSSLLHLLHWQADSVLLRHGGSPNLVSRQVKLSTCLKSGNTLAAGMTSAERRRRTKAPSARKCQPEGSWQSSVGFIPLARASLPSPRASLWRASLVERNVHLVPYPL